MLVIENAAGQVEDIHQLAGGENNSGFAALAQYDANGDGENRVGCDWRNTRDGRTGR